RDVLLSGLAGQLGLEEFPEPTGELVSELGTWSLYLVEIEAGVSVNVSVAVAEVDNTTYLVLLQSAPDEHDSLREMVFTPVVESILVLSEEENTEPLPYIAEDVTFMSGDLTLAGTL